MSKECLNRGVTVICLLGIAIVVLNLVGVIDLPWLWVLHPFSIATPVAALIGLIMLIQYLKK